MTRLGHKILVWVILGLSSALIGCTPVKPWQKEYLAHRTMALDPDPLESAFRQHVYQSREASSGGYSVGISSCGCH